MPGLAASDQWGYLETLDPAAGAITLRPEGKDQPVTLRLLPYAAFWRFGSAGSLPTEYRKDDRLLVRTLSVPPRPRAKAIPYVIEVRDEITEQIRRSESCQITAQDTNAYTFTVDRRVNGQSNGSPLALEYGRGTFLVLREEPIYTFRVRGMPDLWMNTARKTGADFPIAREVFDEVSRERYRVGQRLRMLARAVVSGAPGVVTTAAGGKQVRLFPDYAEAATRFPPGTAVEALEPGRTDSGARLTVTAQKEQTLTLSGALPGARPGRIFHLRPVRDQVSYPNDIKPLLDAACLSCHRDSDARSGYSLSSRERLLRGSRRGIAVVPGKPAESLLYLTMTGERNPRMPPERDSTPEQLTLLKAWIEAGAPTE